MKLISLISLMLLVSAYNACAADKALSVLVEQARAEERVLPKTLTVYGRVQPDSDAVLTLSLPRAGLITHVGARLGQRVKHGDVLLEFSTSPTARMEFIKAKNAVDYAKAGLERQSRLFNEQMSTKSQVDGAKKALDDAKSALKALRAQGKGHVTEQVNAPVDGIITQINIKQGDRVQADTAALALATENRLVALLGAEPEDIRALKPGMAVMLKSVFISDYEALTKLREVHAMINPSTHLVDLLAPIPPEKTDPLILGSYLTAELTISKHKGVTVPRNAVLEDDKGRYVFTVVDERAKRIAVITGKESDRWIEIKSGVKAGQNVVTTGNYVLKDGNSIREAQ